MNWMEETFGIRLADPQWLMFLLAIPFCMLLAGRFGRRRAVAYPGVSTLKRISGNQARERPGGLSISFMYLAMAVTAISLARPQLVKAKDTITASGIDVIAAVDLSKSMDIHDFYVGRTPVSRLVAAKRVLRQFVAGRKHDRIGVVAFAGRPFTMSPLTLDHEWINEGIDRLQMNKILDGTAIGKAIALSAARLKDQESKSKVIVLITDGSDNFKTFTPQDAAKLAADLGIRIYTISIGTPGKHKLIIDGMTTFIESSFDPKTLHEVAGITGGRFFRAENTGTLEEVFKTIDTLEKSEIVQHRTVRSKDIFPWFVAGTIILTILSIVFSNLIALKVSP